ncbi:DUF2946 domain-containing protein [Bradyrhizobium sp. 186]|nr:DUF2946 domain-containing protein [Bradyrhizobium sp. 186]
MRARLQKFLPIVLLALVMQVLAPIAACLAAGQAVADPLQTAVICHSVSEQGGADQSGTPKAHGGGCSICCLVQASASLDSPPQAILAAPFRAAERVVWRPAADRLAVSRGGSNAQARAPPRAT